MDSIPEGQRFSQVYLRSDKLLPDSQRARRRLYRLFTSLKTEYDEFSSAIEGRTGAEIPSGYYGPHWDSFFMDAELRDVLDSLTVIDAIFRRGGREGKWRAGISMIFREEALHYRLDNKGGVHLAVDDEFERNFAATIAGLGESRFVAARGFFEDAQRALDGEPPKTREAIRGVFDALENVFKIATGQKAARLGASEINKFLPPIISLAYSGAEANFANRMLASFKEWVNAAHQYRHTEGDEEAAPPSMESAILAVSLGGAFLRWLIQLENHVKK